MPKQGDVDARCVLARLAPLQGDTPAEQAAQLPDLASLPLSDRAALAAQ